MPRLLWLLLYLVLIPNVGISSTVELSKTVKSVRNIEVVLFTITSDDSEMCPNICYFWGGHIARAFTASNKKQPAAGERKLVKHNYTLGGFDLYAKITGGKITQRFGLGFSLFDKQTEELQTPWDFRISMQTSYLLWGDHLRLFLEFMHWSNCRGCIEDTPLVKIWPKENNGGDSLLAGLTWVF